MVNEYVIVIRKIIPNKFFYKYGCLNLISLFQKQLDLNLVDGISPRHIVNIKCKIEKRLHEFGPVIEFILSIDEYKTFSIFLLYVGIFIPLLDNEYLKISNINHNGCNKII